MAESTIIVPIRIEGNYLKEQKQAASPLADFSKLPYNDGKKDIHFDQPFVGDGVMRQPFEIGYTLSAGFHIHFILPHFLGKQYPVSSNQESIFKGEPQSKMPAAPNRWIVTKQGQGVTTEQWLIQSDYVYHENENPSHTTSVIPFIGGKPYRFMGKKIDFSDAQQGDPGFDNNFSKYNNQQSPLTIMGYGDVNYSSFYPNCHGVFGIHDNAPLPANDTSISYQIIGWVAEDANDILLNQLPQIATKVLNASVSNTQQDVLIEQFNKELNKLFGIEIEGINDLKNFSVSGKTLYCGVIQFDVQNSTVTAPPKPNTNLNIAIGNTGTEALSALLANTISSDNNIITAANIGSSNTPKSIIEDQLEAILMRSKLDGLLIDTGAKFREARHDKGFKAHHSGHLWKVKLQSPEQLSTNATEAAYPPLPQKIEDLLNALNSAQVAYDKATHEIKILQEQLYADWVKYMHARYPQTEGRGEYPQADHIQYFIENYSMQELAPLIAKTGKVVFKKNTTTQHIVPTTQSDVSAVLANDLVSAWFALHNYLQQENIQRSANQQPKLFLALIAGPRFWEATAPVVLFSGLESESIPSQTLSCKAAAPFFQLPYSVAVLPDFTAGANPILDSRFIFNYSNQQWTPFILDWSVELIDTKLRHSAGYFESKALQKNFEFNTKSPDFEKSPAYTAGKTSIFSGSVLMSGHAKLSISKNIEAFFKAYFQKYEINFNNNANNNTPYTLDDFLNQSAHNLTFAVTNWTASVATILDLSSKLAQSSDFNILIGQSNISNPYFTAWVAYGQLAKNHVLSQNLDGFNEACIMKKKVPQLPIAEPIGFNYEQVFTKNVSSLVQGQQYSSPIMAFEFNPIRSGVLSLDKLNLIDNFGLPHKIDTDIPTITSDTMQDQNGAPFLKPRLVQPARLNLRWSSANSTASSTIIDTNDALGTSPVCGWLVANYLNSEIAVYDASGSALGYISLPDQARAQSTGIWNTVPWTDQVTDIDANINNDHLKAVVKLLCDSTNSAVGANTNFISDFLTSTQHALDNIAPANATIYDVKSILMGRPMAVVRSRVSFELMGKPVLDQSWSSLLTDLSNCDNGAGWRYDDRNKDKWEKMLLPCRLGEYKQLNDGLVGYWVEDQNGNLIPNFISPEMQTTDVTDTNFEGISNDTYPTQWLAPDDAPLHLTMLMDPRGVLHATTGLLPTKVISIPPEYYLPAMQKIEMWFKTSPILQAATPDNKNVILNVPPVNGYKWQWWDAYQGTKTVSKNDPATHHHDTSKIIEGWLALVPNSKNES